MTSSRDWTCIVWNLEKGQRESNIQFTSPVLEAQMHPRGKWIFGCIAQGDPPMLVKKETEWTKHFLSIDESDGSLASAIVFSPDGQYLLVGTTKGSIYVFRVDSLEQVYVTKIPGSSSSIRQMHFSSSAR